MLKLPPCALISVHIEKPESSKHYGAWLASSFWIRMVFLLENDLILVFVQNVCLPVAFNKHQACPCTSCGLTASSDMSVTTAGQSYYML